MEIDLKGLRCPMPIVKLNAHIKTAEVGSTVSLVADDPAFADDVRAWCKKTKHTLVSLDNRGTDGIVAIVKKERDGNCATCSS